MSLSTINPTSAPTEAGLKSILPFVGPKELQIYRDLLLERGKVTITNGSQSTALSVAFSGLERKRLIDETGVSAKPFKTLIVYDKGDDDYLKRTGRWLHEIEARRLERYKVVRDICVYRLEGCGLESLRITHRDSAVSVANRLITETRSHGADLIALGPFSPCPFALDWLSLVAKETNAATLVYSSLGHIDGKDLCFREATPSSAAILNHCKETLTEFQTRAVCKSHS
ncbi:hypothetical protein [Beijerinckia mobilis]|uniref:hypothetical protein n=1 Tax=Beijerinckia mobilis TaxID=231434 RepID=UPI0012EC1CA3|nr:hypothetical protein [Beijerinckia mobilis]